MTIDDYVIRDFGSGEHTRPGSTGRDYDLPRVCAHRECSSWPRVRCAVLAVAESG